MLKQYILQGYAVNQKRIQQLGEAIRLMKRAENDLDSKQVLSVIERYRHIKENFFEARGYGLDGELTIIGEGDPGFEEACEKSEEKYQQWKKRQFKSRHGILASEVK